MFNKKSVLVIVLLTVIFGAVVLFNLKSPRRIETVTAFISSDSVAIQSKNAGKIKSLPVKQSDKIQKGQVIAEIETSVQISKPPKDSGKNLKIAEKEYEDAALMYKDGVISKSEYDTYLNNLTKTRNEKSKNQIVQTSYITKIYAPIDGTIFLNNLKEGDNITKESILAEVNSTHKEINAYFSVSEKNEIKPGKLVDITVIKYPEKKFSGKISQVLRPDGKGLPVKITFDQNVSDLDLLNGDSVIVKVK